LALRCATDVAAALRELHQAGRAHGDVSPASIVLRPSGATLLPPNSLAMVANPRADVAAFGAILYQMLTGGRPPRSGLLAAPSGRAPHAGPSGLLAAATRLAGRCLAAPPQPAPTIQMVVTEVRLLSVLTKQMGPESPAPPLPAPPLPASSVPAPARETRTSGPRAEWPAAAAQPVAKPAHAAPAETFVGVGGEPTQEFVRAMLSTNPVPSQAPSEHKAKLPTEERGDAPNDEEEIDQHAPSPAEKCPKCASRQVHHSHPRTKLEFLASRFGIPICRCHRCYHRYFVIFRMAIGKMGPE
jgi:DNA-directed RNA polymerase subunit M/transcription elongation factor TFIIS